MPLEIVTPASSYALTTAAKIATATGVSGVDTSLILAASALVVGYTRRAWAYEEVRETLQGPDARRLVLSRTPVAAVSLVEVDEVEIDASEYQLEHPAIGFLYRDAGWPANRGLAPGAGTFPGRDTFDLPYRVTYTGGYWLPSFAGSPTTEPLLPDAVEHAAIELAKALHLRRREAGGASIEEESTPDYRVKYSSTSGDSGGPSSVAMLSPVAAALLAPYVRTL